MQEQREARKIKAAEKKMKRNLRKQVVMGIISGTIQGINQGDSPWILAIDNIFLDVMVQMPNN